MHSTTSLAKNEFLAAAVIVLLFCLRLSLAAEVEMPKVFTNNMVLQRELPVTIWGRADSQEDVTVTFSDQTLKTTADENGQWSVTLKAMKADAVKHTLKVSGGNELIFNNVLLGEVWICSGQSNMCRGLPISEETDSQEFDLPNIRLFGVQPGSIYGDKDFHTTRGWAVCSSDSLKATGPQIGNTLRAFTEVGYRFGEKVHKELHVPVGLIQTAWGGSKAVSWIPTAKDENNHVDGQEVAKIKHVRGGCYQLALKHLIPFTVRGVVWYQGEDDGENADYHKDFKEMIEGWREVFKRPNMPFYFAQITPTNYMNGRMQWLWQSQLWVNDNVKNTGMAFSNDVPSLVPTGEKLNNQGPGLPLCGSGNPHPKNKHIIAERLANLALVKTYKQKDRVIYGPRYDSHKIEDGKLIIKFKNVGTGLATRDGKVPNWFILEHSPSIVMHSYKYHSVVKHTVAKAQISGTDTVILDLDQGKKLVNVTMGWHCETRFNLMNKEGLPAASFNVPINTSE